VDVVYLAGDEVKKPAKKKSQADVGARGTLWYFEPHELTIVGHDTDEQEHELCDHESNAFAAERYDEYIQYMRLNGIDKPIIFRREPGGRILVVEGRTTTRVARIVAPLWEQDRKAEGVKDAEDRKLKIPGVVRRGTADELFCVSRAANRRRPGSDSALVDAKSLARLVNNGATEEQAATRLGIAPSRGKQLLAVLQLEPKLQRRVGADISLDAAAKLAKMPRSEQVAKLAQITAAGDKPTARAVTNKVREASGKPAVETAAQKLKRISEVFSRLDGEPTPRVAVARLHALDEIRAILCPPTNGARSAPPFAEDPMEAFGSGGSSE
jgi:hypothetical protein